MGSLAGAPASRCRGNRCARSAVVLPVVSALLHLCAAFNLDAETRVVFSGPAGSYFGYSVEFFGNASSIGVLIGAPKANGSQPEVSEGGAVYSCPWSRDDCSIVHFDTQGDRYFYINDVDTQVEFKSHQWFGATVRSHGNSILACAPRYYWRTEHSTPFADLTGSCYLSVDSLKTFVEYAPCRTERHGPAGQGYCQGGFSADFTKDGRVVLGGPGSFYWQGQLISASTEEIVKAYYPAYFLLSVAGQIQTSQVQGTFDDSYLGYSVAAGEFSGDDEEDFITGVPKGLMLYGLVSILDGKDLKSLLNLTGEQMGSYFGYAVAATDINSDGLDDLVVGAPMFMRQGSQGRLEELGKVYVYLQRGPLLLDHSPPHLLGPQAFGRFGSSLAPLGDLNQDGFNDVAVGCPYGGDDQQGLVFIYNGHAGGLWDSPTQSLSGQWATSAFPAGFGFALRGNRDLDQNGYPDLLVGAFGADKAVLYRARPIVSASAWLSVQPAMFHQEERTCWLSPANQTLPVSCVSVTFCLLASGKHLPPHLGMAVELQLDSAKQHQESVRRTLFLESQRPDLLKTFRLANGERVCYDTKVYLRAEDEFRDKLSPIYISLNFSLDHQAALERHGLQPILNYQTEQLIQQKAQIQLDCGEDNICVPDLQLAVYGDRTEVYLGDENSLSITFNARNEGEGGAYEAELYVALPAEADYSGIARNNVSLSQLTCTYQAENRTRYLVCDLGNPMKSGTSLWAGLRFTVPRLTDTHSTVHFQLQIRSKNVNNSESEAVPYELEVSAMADAILQGVSRPDKVVFPPPNWSARQSLVEEQDVGPELQQVYELVNNGPAMVSVSTLELRCPLKAHGYELLYPMETATEGPLSCSSTTTFNALKLKSATIESPTSLTSNGEHHIQRREASRDPLAEQGNLTCSGAVECWHLQCDVGLLGRGDRVVLAVRSRLWAETFMERAHKQFTLQCLAQYKVEKMPYSIPPKFKPSGSKKVETVVMWTKPDSHLSVPVWIIILAVFAGLLLLALLIYLLYKMGFFKRSDPYGTTMEKAQLKPQASSEA